MRVFRYMHFDAFVVKIKEQLKETAQWPTDKQQNPTFKFAVQRHIICACFVYE